MKKQSFITIVLLFFCATSAIAQDTCAILNNMISEIKRIENNKQVLVNNFIDGCLPLSALYSRDFMKTLRDDFSMDTLYFEHLKGSLDTNNIRYLYCINPDFRSDKEYHKTFRRKADSIQKVISPIIQQEAQEQFKGNPLAEFLINHDYKLERTWIEQGKESYSAVMKKKSHQSKYDKYVLQYGEAICDSVIKEIRNFNSSRLSVYFTPEDLPFYLRIFRYQVADANTIMIGAVKTLTTESNVSNKNYYLFIYTKRNDEWKVSEVYMQEGILWSLKNIRNISYHDDGTITERVIEKIK